MRIQHARKHYSNREACAPQMLRVGSTLFQYRTLLSLNLLRSLIEQLSSLIRNLTTQSTSTLKQEVQSTIALSSCPLLNTLTKRCLKNFHKWLTLLPPMSPQPRTNISPRTVRKQRHKAINRLGKRSKIKLLSSWKSKRDNFTFLIMSTVLPSSTLYTRSR
jgi:recombinational DNA repair ATPase RecF